MADLTADDLARIAGVAARFAELGLVARAGRDDAIRLARSQGFGVRELARITELDPKQVQRILSR